MNDITTMPTLETERLILRAFNEHDVDAMYLLGTIPEIIRYAGNQPLQSKAQAEEYLHKHPLRDYQVHGYGRYALVWKASNEVIGFSGIKFLDEVQENELGYRLYPEYWGKGLATEAARAVLPYAKQTLKLRRLISLIHPDNHASKNVVRKLGFKLEKCIRFLLLEECETEVHAGAL